MLEERLNGLALMYVHRDISALQKQWWMSLPVSGQEDLNLLIHLLTRNFHSLYCSRFVVYVSIGMIISVFGSVYLTLLIEVRTFNARAYRIRAHVLCIDVGVVQRLGAWSKISRAHEVKHPPFRGSCIRP